jgi:hypothetical protein
VNKINCANEQSCDAAFPSEKHACVHGADGRRMEEKKWQLYRTHPELYLTFGRKPL